MLKRIFIFISCITINSALFSAYKGGTVNIGEVANNSSGRVTIKNTETGENYTVLTSPADDICGGISGASLNCTPANFLRITLNTCKTCWWGTFIPWCTPGEGKGTSDFKGVSLEITTPLGTVKLCDAYWGTCIVGGNIGILKNTEKIMNNPNIADGTTVFRMIRDRIYYMIIDAQGYVTLTEYLH